MEGEGRGVTTHNRWSGHLGSPPLSSQLLLFFPLWALNTHLNQTWSPELGCHMDDLGKWHKSQECTPARPSHTSNRPTWTLLPHRLTSNPLIASKQLLHTTKNCVGNSQPTSCYTLEIDSMTSHPILLVFIIFRWNNRLNLWSYKLISL